MVLKIWWPLASLQLHVLYSAWIWIPEKRLLVRRRCEHACTRGKGTGIARVSAPPPGVKAGGWHPVDGRKKVYKSILFFCRYTFFLPVYFSICCRIPYVKKSIPKYTFFWLVYFFCRYIFSGLVYFFRLVYFCRAGPVSAVPLGGSRPPLPPHGQGQFGNVCIVSLPCRVDMNEARYSSEVSTADRPWQLAWLSTVHQSCFNNPPNTLYPHI